MLRQGRWKYVWSEPDEPQLYDLSDDPAELHNLAADPLHAAEAARFAAEVARRWDAESLRGDVVANQQARALVDRALRQGRYRAWDHQPVTDASELYMRNHLDLNDVEATRRR
jgi:choline-sulfatase